MEEKPNKPVYDLEERIFQFAKQVRLWVKNLPKTIANTEDEKQLVRAPGSIGANYIEANESLSKKDFHFRIKIFRKEAKESGYWLRLILESYDNLHVEDKGYAFFNESIDIKKIFSAIAVK